MLIRKRCLFENIYYLTSFIAHTYDSRKLLPQTIKLKMILQINHISEKMNGEVPNMEKVRNASTLKTKQQYFFLKRMKWPSFHVLLILFLRNDSINEYITIS